MTWYWTGSWYPGNRSECWPMAVNEQPKTQTWNALHGSNSCVAGPNPVASRCESAWLLLLHCVSGRVNFQLRVVRPSVAENFARTHDAGCGGVCRINCRSTRPSASQQCKKQQQCLCLSDVWSCAVLSVHKLTCCTHILSGCTLHSRFMRGYTHSSSGLRM